MSLYKNNRALVQRILWKRQNGRCAYCGERMVSPKKLNHPRRLTLDHIIPRSKGGGNAINNLVAACRACNEAKADESAPLSIFDAKPPVEAAA